MSSKQYNIKPLMSCTLIDLNGVQYRCYWTEGPCFANDEEDCYAQPKYVAMMDGADAIDVFCEAHLAQYRAEMPEAFIWIKSVRWSSGAYLHGWVV